MIENYTKKNNILSSPWNLFLKTSFISALMVVVNLLHFSSIHQFFVYLHFQRICLWHNLFALLVLYVIAFVYIELKQNLILEAKPNPLCLSHLLALFHKFALILPGSHYCSDKKKSLYYFLETAMYECSIFWMMMMVLINLVVNAVLFWLEVMPGRIW